MATTMTLSSATSAAADVGGGGGVTTSSAASAAATLVEVSQFSMVHDLCSPPLHVWARVPGAPPAPTLAQMTEDQWKRAHTEFFESASLGVIDPSVVLPCGSTLDEFCMHYLRRNHQHRDGRTQRNGCGGGGGEGGGRRRGRDGGGDGDGVRGFSDDSESE